MSTIRAVAQLDSQTSSGGLLEIMPDSINRDQVVLVVRSQSLVGFGDDSHYVPRQDVRVRLEELAAAIEVMREAAVFGTRGGPEE